MNLPVLTICLFLSLFFGMLYVKYLTVPPLNMGFYSFATCLYGFSLVVLLFFNFSGKNLFLSIFTCIVFILIGYSIMTYIFLNKKDKRPVPKLIRNKKDKGDGHTAIIYFTHGEPELYDPIGWLNQFKEFDEQKIKFVPSLVRPYFIYNLRKHYLAVGKSNHRQEHLKMIKSLEKKFRAQGDKSTKFYISFLDDNPRPNAAVISALNDGASKIIVSEVFLTISNHTAEGKIMIGGLKLSDYNVPILYTTPLWDSEKLKSMFVKRANENIGDTDKSNVGIMLIGHGQPAEWDIDFKTETEQEILFRENIINKLVDDGYKRENIGLAWMEFKEPKPAILAEKLIKNGVEKILFFSAAISADSMHSQYDIPNLVYKAKIPKRIEVINLGAWNDDEIVISAIKEKIDNVK